MATHDDGESIDFNKLEKELMQAVEADARYWRENDAKIRAVTNKVATYEEFKDLVLAAHLKPLDKGDKVSTTFNQPWNSTANRSKSGHTPSANQDTDQIKQVYRLPKNGQEFVRDWRRYYKTDQERCAFLLYIGPQKLQQIFKAEISFGLLGDFMSALSLGVEQSPELVFDILNSLRQVNRFALSVRFMSKAEKDSCKKLFDALEGKLTCITSDSSDGSSLLPELQTLRDLYDVKNTS
ncbi:coiled-coil domain-containing protein 103-like [Liolophura sinensis]|uniref:coiled-coil domain-containing protein 103-like n=1 Tax=Liolophura sinensis TaxID=3198878 RepID=UPI003158664C